MITGKIPVDSIARSQGDIDPIINLEGKYGGRYNRNFLQAIQKAMSIKSSLRFQSIKEFQQRIYSKTIPTSPLPKEITFVEKNWIIISCIIFIISIGLIITDIKG